MARPTPSQMIMDHPKSVMPGVWYLVPEFALPEIGVDIHQACAFCKTSFTACTEKASGSAILMPRLWRSRDSASRQSSSQSIPGIQLRQQAASDCAADVHDM